MDGYYDPSPTLDLARPLVLAGYVADETRKIGFRLSALAGLPAANLDRLIEHAAGKSIRHLILTEGEARYRQLEREALRRALADRPSGVLSLGDGTVIDPANRRLLATGSDLVALDVDAAGCYWRMSSSPDASGDPWHPLYGGPLLSLQQMQPFYDLRASALGSARHHVEIGGQSAGKIVDTLRPLLLSLGH